jgi:hypothetical protein
MQKDMETLLVYYSDTTYMMFSVHCGVGARRQNTTSFRCILRVKLKDKTNA